MYHINTVTCVSGQVDALGGPAVLALASKGALIVSVEENETSMRATAKSLMITHVQARSYAEAAGIIAAHKEGILLDAVTKSVSPISILEL